MVTALGEDVLVSSKADLGEGAMADSAQYGYWRKPDGWITTSGVWPTNYIKKARQGWAALDREYGTFLDETKEWSIRKDPYRRLLERGGAKEFPVDQILELGWHRDPPRVKGRAVHFPQLTGVETEDVQCLYCRRWFITSIHLHKHQSVMHKEIAQNEQLARVLGENARAVTAGTSSSLGDAVQMIGQLIQQLAKRQEDQEARQERQEARLLSLLERLGGSPPGGEAKVPEKALDRTPEKGPAKK